MFIKLLINNIRNWNKKVLSTLFLSLILGTGSIIGLFITMETFKEWISAGIEALGANRIHLCNDYDDPQARQRRYIPYKDILRLKQVCPTIRLLGCAYHGMSEGRYELVLLKNKKKIDIFNRGVSPEFAKVMGFEVKKGRFIEIKDEGKNVCVLTEDIANKLNANVGDIIQYSGKRVAFNPNTYRIEFDQNGEVKIEKWTYYLKIKGIVKIHEVLYIMYPWLLNKDPGTMFVPVKTKRELKLYGITWSDDLTTKDEYEGNIYIKVSDVERAIREIKTFLKARYGKDKIFFISKDEFLIGKFKDIQRIWTLLLGIIGIGGLTMGIANIFFTFLSFVSTRKREIGIKRASGAKREDICKEFLMEGIIVILPPILMGAGLGIMLSRVFLKSPVLSLDIIIACIILVFCFSLLALIYPGIKAAFVPPVEAIRE
ncbi:MAG: FtsX-like permease family protein [bacterium]